MNYLYGITYSLIIALGAVLVHEVGSQLPIALILFCSCSLAIVVFHLLNVNKISAMYSKLWQVKSLWIVIMLVIVWMWLCSMYGYYLVHPEIFMLLYFSVNFFLGLANKFFNKRLNTWQVITIFCFSMGSVSLILFKFIQTQLPLTRLNDVGMVLGILGGISTFVYIKLSYKLSQITELSSTQILAVRFWLLFFVALLMFVLLPKEHLILNRDSLVALLVIPLFTMIIPLFLVQQSIIKVGPMSTSILIGLVPAFTYLVAALTAHYYQWQVLLCSLLFIIMIALTEFCSIV